jgi:hypothetical protein
MFHMTNDSHLFRTRLELEEKEGAYPIGGNRFKSPAGEWVPLYEGKMVQAFNHRAAGVHVNPNNRHRAALPEISSPEQLGDSAWTPAPQFWVAANKVAIELPDYLLAFKDVTSPTNVRSMIAALIPRSATGNTLPLIISDTNNSCCKHQAHMLANMNSLILDFLARQKIQGQHLNWFIVEQLPVIEKNSYSRNQFGSKTTRTIIEECVLELTYTANDMAPFARDMGYVDERGEVRPPFKWDEDRRLRLRAKLDAIYFHLYGVTDRDDVRYIYSTFPIVERQETEKYGRYLSRDLCLAWMSALAAGDPDAQIEV